jgi:hypothetical protein
MPLLERLQQAFNDRDVEAVVACASEDYRGIQPAHPSRNYAGADQLRVNFSRIFGSVPDFTADLLDSAVVGDKAWSEWHWHGTRADGAPFNMRGVMIFYVADGRTTKCHVYMEPVDAGGEDINAGIQSWTSGAPKSG